jgi:acetyl/propionyl-CoA carboxylase alpha subunit
VFYDPMLSKLVAHAATRHEAITRMKRALAEYRVEGIDTTIPFFSYLMNHPDFIAGRFDTGFIDRLLPEIDFVRARGASNGMMDAAAIAAAILAFEESQRVQLPELRESGWKRAARTEALRSDS